MKTIVLLTVALLALTYFSSLADSAGVQTTGSTKTPIKHMIFIMMENHSFDNIFGVYPNHHNLTATIAGKQENLFLTNPQAQGLTQVPNGSYSSANPVEGYTAYHGDWNNGKMNQFLSYSGPASMHYFGQSQMALEWDLASEFSIGATYFSSTLSETVPNRLFSLAGYSPVKNDYGQPPYIPVDQTIFGELDSYGISWGYYIKNPADGAYILPFIQGISSHGSNVKSWNSLISEAGNGTLPSVSWISPIGGGASGYSQHPPDNMLYGEQFLLYFIYKIMNSPEWNTTSIFITYDEGGGFYDSVAPPVVAGNQLGFRVPFIVISPFSKENYVSTTIMSHTSMLDFIDYNWNLPPLNKLVAFSNIPIDMYDFTGSGSGTVRTPLDLSPISEYIPTNFSYPAISPSGGISSDFPLPMQINTTLLAYSQTGSSHLNLSNKTDYFASGDIPATPFYDSPYFLFFLLITAISVPTAVILKRSKIGK
ncbi:MAG: alkaline phosphatase family protein [Candidatus Thermoplasmatota archaeon]|nr:alkaline phosphatase family protein [Candidatus Thermoplasmatota archaeon]